MEEEEEDIKPETGDEEEEEEEGGEEFDSSDEEVLTKSGSFLFLFWVVCGKTWLNLTNVGGTFDMKRLFTAGRTLGNL